jgi:hypothetical protein
MTITEHYADGSSIDRMFVSQQNVENLDGSSESAGWGLRGMSSFTQQAGSGGVSLSDGAGNVESFTKNTDGSYSRPAGELGFSSLVKNGDGTFSLTDKNQNVSRFTSAGALTGVTDRLGNTSAIQSDSSGNRSPLPTTRAASPRQPATHPRRPAADRRQSH